MKEAPKAQRVAAEAAEAAAAASSRAAAAPVVSGAQRASKIYQVVHELAKKGQRFEGKKVWVKLDEAGNHVAVITPGQAARLAESEKTWVRNMWGR